MEVPLYEVSCETGFSATHRLVQDGRPLEPLHGHDWRSRPSLPDRSWTPLAC